MSQPDPYNRSRHASQAYQTSSFGRPFETGPSGYGRRLVGSPLYSIPFSLPSGLTAKQIIGDLTAGLWVKQLVLHQANTGTMALAIEESSPGAADGVTLVAAQALTAAGQFDLNTQLMPLALDRTLSATLTGGAAAGVLRATLIVCPVTDSWA